MTKIFIYFIYFTLIFISQISINLNACIPGVNHCSICNPINGLCHECDKETFIPDEKGGCEYKKICIYGYNYCLECSKEENLCIKCEEGYYPDEYGGCSYTQHCILSERGKCLKCKENYFLAGIENYFNEGVKICKSIYSEDLKFCESIDLNNGFCDKCKKGYYLNQIDKKCSTTENCDESIYGICTNCHYGFYLDKKDNKCKEAKNIFSHCKESLNGEKCDLCNNNYYFDENGKCIYNNNCLKEDENIKCEKCKENFFLSEKDFVCTITNNCEYGDKNEGLCISCKDNYYIDYKDGKCKSNTEDNEFKFCDTADGICTKCRGLDYFIGEDHKCSTTRSCAESYNGTCIECIDNHHLGLDFKCTNIKHCIYSDYYYNQCSECEGDFYFNRNENICKIGEGNLTNCKISNEGKFCERCKDDYYLNQTDHLCYSNLEKGDFYKCAVTDIYANYCIFCRKDYYAGYLDNKCSKIESCALSENEDTCLECDEYYCLDLKSGKCVDNDFIEDEEKKFYFMCNKTNKEGTSCEICIDGFKINENGLCVNDDFCEEKKDGICQKCKNDEGNYCLNNYFECIEINTGNCLECNDILNIDSCTKCLDGFEIDYYGRCIEIKKN